MFHMYAITNGIKLKMGGKNVVRFTNMRLEKRKHTNN